MIDKRNIIKKKYEKLYWRLHNHPNKSFTNDVWQDDFKWVRNQIADLDCEPVIRKMDLIYANQIWKKYATSNIDLNNVNWVNIDEFIKNSNKIGAIKLYRNRYKCSLRAAKNAVDQRHDDLREKNIISA